MKLSKTAQRAVIITVSAFVFWGILLLLKNWYQSGAKRDNESPAKSNGIHFGYETETAFIPEFWKYHAGNDPLWSAKDFNDTQWDSVKPDLDLKKIPENYFKGTCWFRAKVRVDSLHADRVFGINFTHNGASEIFWDGKLIQSYGTVFSDKEPEEPYLPPFAMFFSSGNAGTHSLAIRYSNQKYNDLYHSIYDQELAGITMRFVSDPEVPFQSEQEMRKFNFALIILFGFFLTLGIVHFLLFIFYRQQKQNLFYSLFALCFSLIFILSYIAIVTTDPSVYLFCRQNILVPCILVLLTLIRLLHSFFHPRVEKIIFTIGTSIGVLALLLYFTGINGFEDIVLGIFFTFACIEFVRSIIAGIRNKLPGSKIIGTGAAIFASFLILILISVVVFGSLQFSANGFAAISLIVLIVVSIISIPLSMSIYLAYDFSRTNRYLAKKLIEVESLSAKTISQEKEKQEILSKQKETLEIQVKERTREVVEQKKVIEEKNKDITDSINYAKRIQDAILPSDEQVKQMLPDSFVLYKPKDIVSGDFYFFSQTNGKVIAAAVDCTGHGVPGAFMSMVGYNHLKRIVNEQGMTDTSKILDELHKQVLLSINRDITKRDSKDGMDVSIISIDKQKREVQFSGAVRPLYYFVNGNLLEVKGDRYSIAGVKEIDGVSYSSAMIPVAEPTTFYLFSDGFADQFGGVNGKKLMSKRFRELLISIQQKPMQEQKTFLENFIEEWKGSREQMDDVMVIGIKI